MSNNAKIYINLKINAIIELGDNMTKIRKKRLKIKKKNFTIFIIIVVLIIYLIVKGTNLLITTLTESPKKEQNKVTEKKLSDKDKKLKKLNNIDKKIDYFNYDYIDRYIDYKNKNKELKMKKVIIDVNIGLDYPYYENTKRAKNLNKSYILVNKYNYLTENYVPNRLEKIDLNYARSGMKLVSYAKEAF